MRLVFADSASVLLLAVLAAPGALRVDDGLDRGDRVL
jgi:hypothetical protein